MEQEQSKYSKDGDEKELETFLQQLEGEEPPGFSVMVTEEDEQVWQEVDCTTCANCCKTMTPVFIKSDIKRIATHLRMTPKAFYEKWLMKEADSGNIINRQQPCQFLIDDKCSIYAVRPVDCAEFPHHYKRPFHDYIGTFVQNVNRCPATRNLINRLYERVNLDDKGR